MASDYDFLPASNGSGNAPLMHVTGTRIVGATTLAVDSITNVPSKFIASYGTLLPTGYIDPATQVDFKGHTSGANLIIDGFEPGSTDAGNVAGQVVVIKPTTGWANRVAQFIKNATNLGTPEAMTASTLTVTSGTTLPAGDIGTNDLAANAVTYAKLLATIFSGQLTTYTNPGTAGGTSSFFYGNIGGIKLFFGTTAVQSISGTGALQGTAVGITLPVGFFTTIQTIQTSIGTVPTGTSALAPVLQDRNGVVSITVILNQITGSNGAAGISVLLIGT